MKTEEKFFHNDKIKIEFHFEGNYIIIIEEVEGILTVTLPSKVKELKSKPVLFCPEDRLTKCEQPPEICKVFLS